MYVLIARNANTDNNLILKDDFTTIYGRGKRNAGERNLIESLTPTCPDRVWRPCPFMHANRCLLAQTQCIELD